MDGYINLFETNVEFSDARLNSYEEPWLSFTEETQEVHYNMTEEEREHIDILRPLTFEIVSGGTIAWKKTASNYADRVIQYRKNGGELTNLSPITGSTYQLTVESGDIIEFYGNNQDYSNGIVYTTFSSSTPDIKYYVYGNMMSLVDSSNFINETTLTNYYTFDRLFYNNKALVSHPTKKIVLPATNATYGCYRNLFYGCTGLTQAPELPATNLSGANYCYSAMFQGCTSLTKAPELPATTLALYCYQDMFWDCTSLTQAPSVLPAERLEQYCYYRMFQGCTSLTQAPELPAANIEYVSYCYMFKGCTNIDYIKCLAVSGMTATNCNGWVSGVSATGTFMKEADATDWIIGVNGIPNGWVISNVGVSSNKNGVNFAESGGSYTITVNSTTPWTASTTDNWITVSPLTGNAGETTIAITAPSTNVSRSGGITIISEENKKTINVIQNDLCFEPLTFNIHSNGNIRWRSQSGGYPRTIEYSINGGVWTEITSATGNTAPSISVVSGDTVQFRGNNDAYCSGGTSVYCTNFSGTTCQFSAKGNVMSLVGGTAFTETDSFGSTNLDYGIAGLFGSTINLINCQDLILPTLSKHSFQAMFYNCINLVSVPKVLPAVRLYEYCYYGMFQGCTSLTGVPSNYLQSTTLANYCYASMFSYCTGLTTAPELPATTLANYCYQYMFAGCTSLTTTPNLPATTLSKYCYSQMFSGCTSLTQVLKLPATTLANHCYQYMFGGCTSLTGVAQDILPATNLSGGGACYYRMFSGCTSLVQVPKLPATTLESSCYEGMFSKCTSLTGVPSDYLPVTNLSGANGCYDEMFYNCTSLTTAPVLPATTLADNCYSQMFQGCTALTQAPNLPATTLESSCYYQMFSNCTSLTQAPSLPATNLSDYCYQYMFSGCTALTTAPALPATTLTNYCYSDMYNGCTSLTGVPSDYLPATNLLGANNCYNSMFYECSNLTQIPNLPATILSEGCYRSMFNRCSKLAQVPTLPATQIERNCYQFMFYGTSITGVPSDYLTATAMTASAYTGMFQNCTKLTQAPTLPATNLSGATACYSQMFAGCTALTQAPALPATSLSRAVFCYSQMFAGCTSLSAVPSDYLPATTLSGYCYSQMFSGCTSLVQAPNLPATTVSQNCYQNMFRGCTSLTTAPANLPATSLNKAGSCYSYMFANCTSLTGVSTDFIKATTLTANCCEYMFSGCTALTQAPTTLPATTLASSCYIGMFRGCRGLTTAPILPATALTSSCYNYMFDGCTNLNYIKCMANSVSGTSYTNTWIKGVASSGTFVKKTGSSWTATGNNGIPSGWDVQEASS